MEMAVLGLIIVLHLRDICETTERIFKHMANSDDLSEVVFALEEIEKCLKDDLKKGKERGDKIGFPLLLFHTFLKPKII